MRCYKWYELMLTIPAVTGELQIPDVLAKKGISRLCGWHQYLHACLLHDFSQHLRTWAGAGAKFHPPVIVIISSKPWSIPPAHFKKRLATLSSSCSPDVTYQTLPGLGTVMSLTFFYGACTGRTTSCQQ
jgi:hypothetical protein